LNRLAAILIVVLLGACAAPERYDYSTFRESRPASILVLPPLIDSPVVDAPHGMLAHATLPLAESGYYVFPVTLVDETFRQNGLDSAAEIHQLPPAKLHEIFGADSALYINITEYGTSYKLLLSETRVTAEGRLVDLRTGQRLWEGSATASSDETNSSNGGLLGAIITQIIETLMDESYTIAGITSLRLLSAGRPNGILYGPRSPNYLKDGSPSP
jgi:hypothetical protein